MAQIYYHIDLENLVAGLVSPNMLDTLWTSKYWLIIYKRSPFIIKSVLLRNPWNQIFAFNLFVGSHIPLSKHVQTEKIKVCRVLMIPQEMLNRIIVFQWMKTYLKMKLLENMGILMYPKCLSCIHIILLITNWLCHLNNMTKSFGFVLLKWLMNTR